MNKLIYWLIETVLTTPIPLSWLTAANIEVLLNRPHHGATLDDLAVTFMHLCTQGYLGVYATIDFNEWEELPIPPRTQEVQAALHNQLAISYGLTPKGGAYWEATTQPDWERYLVEYSSNLSTIMAGSQPQLQWFVDHYDWLHSDRVMKPYPHIWETIQPWHATYWKTLPLGYSLQFQTYSIAQQALPTTIVAEWRVRSQWYTRLFD